MYLYIFKHLYYYINLFIYNIFMDIKFIMYTKLNDNSFRAQLKKKARGAVEFWPKSKNR